MTETTREFLKLLFNEGETISVSPHVYGYHSVEQSALDGDIVLVHPDKDEPSITIKEKDIALVAINPIKGFRRDRNVTAFRTFLVEIDTGTLDEQRKYIDDSGLPYSVCVYSGNKSLHFAVVLDKNLQGVSMWRFFNKWILNILTKVDQQLVNPTRSIRFPGNVRKDGKKLPQKLIVSKGRVKQEDFFKWIYQFEDKKPSIEVKLPKASSSTYQGMADVSKIPKDVKDILKEGIYNERNGTWFYVACRIAKIGFSEEQTTEYLEQFFEEEKDFKRSEWESCIKSAYKTVQGKS